MVAALLFLRPLFLFKAFEKGVGRFLSFLFSLHTFHLWICSDVMAEGDQTKYSSKAFMLKLHYSICHGNLTAQNKAF